MLITALFTHTAIECEPLTAIVNAIISYSTVGSPNYAFETVATYSCNFGFFMDLTVGGSGTRTCGDDGDGNTLGVFSDTAPSCVGKSVSVRVPMQV